MKKRLLIVGVPVIILLAAFTGFFIFSQKKSTSQLPGPGQLSTSPTPAVKLLTWDDPAGFTFQYPEGVVIDKHDEDMENYAHVELTNKNHPGSLIVWAKDTTAADVKAWVATEKQLKGLAGIDTTLGGQPAKKVAIGEENVIVGTIFDELLFEIEGKVTDKAYWSGVVDSVAASFTFKPLEGSSDTSGGSGEAADEEETVQ